MTKHQQLCLLFLLALTGILPMSAQQRQRLTIERFALDPFDRTAQNERYQRMDSDERPMAIIKVSSTSHNDKLRSYSFDFGNIPHQVDSADHDDGTLWVYVARNAKLVTIRRQGYTTISKHDLGTTVEAGRTYTMVLSPEVRPLKFQMVQFNIRPTGVGATVAVKNEENDADFEKFGDADDNGNTSRSLALGSYTYKVLADDYLTTTGSFTLNNERQTHIENIMLKPNFAEVTLVANANAEIFVDGDKKGNSQWTGRLKAGNHQAEVRQANHRPAYTTFDVTLDGPTKFSLQAPTPITGSLSVATSPSGADITIDGVGHGQSPRIISDLIIGQHQVTLSKPGYTSLQYTADIKEDETYRLEDITLDSEEKPKKERKKRMPSTAFYIQPGIQAGSLMAATGTIGAYIAGFNIEASYGLGLGKSETIYWNPTTDASAASVECTYKPTMFGAKLGYGIAATSWLRFTPQAGITVVNISTPDADSKGNATSMAFGLRIELQLVPHFALYAAPEMGFALKQSDTYKRLKAVSPKIKSWAGDFNVRAGLSLSF